MANKPVCVTATYLRSYNFGATLQAYSLDRALKKVGFSSIYFDMPHAQKIYELPFHFGSILDIKRSILKLFSLFHISELKRMYSRFDCFVADNIKTTKVFEDMQDLLSSLPHADCYLTGSDQVFTMRIDPLLRKIRLLDFNTNRSIKCSYAASLADYNLSDNEKAEFNRILLTYNKVSVREKKTVNYMGDFVMKPIDVHIDPVFLTTSNQWEDLVQDVPSYVILPEHYILVIVVTENSVLNKTIIEVKKKIGDLPVICIRTSPAKTVIADKYCFDFGPKEWVYAIANADYVITSSFHGTCFSIIFKKQFSVVMKEKANPVRITELLERFSLEDRLVRSVQTDVWANKSIDYISTERVIDFEREKSLQYLQTLYILAEQNMGKGKYDEI